MNRQNIFCTTAAPVLLMHLLSSSSAATSAFVSSGAARCKSRPHLAVVRSSLNKSPDEADDNSDTVSSSGSAQGARRRDVLQSAVMAASLAGSSTGGGGGAPAVAAATTKTATTSSLVDLPMIRFRLPGSSVDYAGVQVCLEGRRDEPVEFMLDTGLTLEMMTPHLSRQLGLRSQRTGIRGITAGGTSSGTDLVTWTGASLCGDGDGAAAFPLPEMHAIVTDFPQEHIDPGHDPIEGMLGQELLSRYDLDLDFPAGRVRLYQPGMAAQGVDLMKEKMVEIPAVEINDTGLIGIRLTTAATKDGRQPQPVLAFLDCGSTFSAVNTKAAALWGLPTSPRDPVFQNGPKMLAVGIDGRPMQLPTIAQSLSFAGEARPDQATGRLLGFDPPPRQWKPWKAVQMVVADLPVFPELLGDGVTPYLGPAALLGLDVLSQRRVIFEAAAADKVRSRRRRLFVSAV